jgi:type IV secretion system protein VirB11
MHPNAPRSIEPLIGDAIDVLVHIARKEGGAGRIVREILEVKTYDPEKRSYVFLTPI